MLPVWGCRYCLQFAVSHGFRFDTFILGNVAVGGSITLSWHRNGSDPNRVLLSLANATQDGLLLETLAPAFSAFSASDLGQPDGTLNVTFRELGCVSIFAISIHSPSSYHREYFIHVMNYQGHVIAVSQKFIVQYEEGVGPPLFGSTQQSGAPERSVFAPYSTYGCHSISSSQQFLQGTSTKHCISVTVRRFMNVVARSD